MHERRGAVKQHVMLFKAVTGVDVAVVTFWLQATKVTTALIPEP